VHEFWSDRQWLGKADQAARFWSLDPRGNFHLKAFIWFMVQMRRRLRHNIQFILLPYLGRPHDSRLICHGRMLIYVLTLGWSWVKGRQYKTFTKGATGLQQFFSCRRAKHYPSTPVSGLNSFGLWHTILGEDEAPDDSHLTSSGYG
jgi:hypothetical protein